MKVEDYNKLIRDIVYCSKTNDVYKQCINTH